MGIFDFFKKSKNIITDNGENKTYYEKGNGELRESFYKKEGKLHGRYYEKFMWGEVKQVGQYKNGKKDGEWIYNGQDGTSNGESSMWVVNYKNGVLNGKFEQYQLLFQPKYVHDSSYEKILVGEGNCINGLKEGEWVIYSPQIKKESVKLNGILDMEKEVFIDYKHTYKIKYLKGVLTENNYNLNEELYPGLDSKIPEIHLNTISDHICDGDESRRFTTSFINRSVIFEDDGSFEIYKKTDKELEL
jgi:hypothetical protein